MLRLLRAVFGDPSQEALIATAKDTLRSPNAPLQEQAEAIERLSSNSDAESKALVLAVATNTRANEWLQQVAGEAVAYMLENNALEVGETHRLTATAREVAAAFLERSDQEKLREHARQLQSATPVSPTATPKAGSMRDRGDR
jgi:hypothetical protein